MEEYFPYYVRQEALSKILVRGSLLREERKIHQMSFHLTPIIDYL